MELLGGGSEPLVKQRAERASSLEKDGRVDWRETIDCFWFVGGGAVSGDAFVPGPVDEVRDVSVELVKESGPIANQDQHKSGVVELRYEVRRYPG